MSSCLLYWQLIDCKCVSLCLGSLFCSVDHLSVFCASITLLWLLWPCSIVWSLGWLCFLLLFFFLWIALAIMDLLWFHINFRIICSSSVKSVMGNLTLLVSQLCLTLCEPMDCSLLGSSLFMRFSKQEYWSGLPFPSPGDLPGPGIEPRSPTLQADSLPSEPPGKLDWIKSAGP